MAAKQKPSAAEKKLREKLKKAQRLNFILILICAVLAAACIWLASASCSSGKGTDLPSTETVSVSVTDVSQFEGTYQYLSDDDSYGFAIEFTDIGAVWFYEATKDDSLVQGFVGAVAKAADLSDSDSDVGYYIPLSYVDMTPYVNGHVELELLSDGSLLLTQLEDGVLTQRAPVGEPLTLTPVENYSLGETIVRLYADEMTE